MKTKRSEPTAPAKSAQRTVTPKEIRDKEKHVQKMIRFYSETLPRAMARLWASEIKRLQAILDGGTAAIIRQVNLEKRHKAEQERRNAKRLGTRAAT